MSDFSMFIKNDLEFSLKEFFLDRELVAGYILKGSSPVFK